jgi:hypothetical protein
MDILFGGLLARFLLCLKAWKVEAKVKAILFENMGTWKLGDHALKQCKAL